MLTATKQWFTLPVLISCYCFVCTQANSGSVYFANCPLITFFDCDTTITKYMDQLYAPNYIFGTLIYFKNI